MKLIRMVALVAALVLVAAACSDDDGDDVSSDDTSSDTSGPDSSEPDTTDTGGSDGDFSSILLPKCTGNAVFDQANEGAQEAAEELGIADPEFVAPATCDDSTGQVEFVTNGTTQGVDAIMVSNNAADQIETATEAAADAGVTVVAWDSPIPSAAGESLFVAQVDFDETGTVMADMAIDILGEEGGELAILSASPDAANQNAWIASFEEVLGGDDYSSLELVD